MNQRKKISPFVSVVIPVFNNAHTLPELTFRLSNHLNENNFSFEIIYVDDASYDDSLKILIKLKQENDYLKYIHMMANKGQHLAILKGMEIAKGERIIIMDADLQDKPELITPMLDLDCDDKEAVFVIRRGIYQSHIRMFTSYLIKNIVRFISGLHHKAGSYFLLNRTLLDKVLKLAQNCRYPYISIIVGSSAAKIKYIKGNRAKSIGNSNYTFLKRSVAAFRAIYCSVYCKIKA